MKTKTTIGSFIALFFIVALATAMGSTPIVVAKAAVVVNGAPTSANIPSLPSKVTVADVGLSGIVHIGTALQFEFQDSAGHPINVDNFQAARADFTLVGNGVTYWNATPLGSYHPDAQGTPYYHAYNVGGVDVSPASGYVAGYLGNNSGVVLPTVSKFQVTSEMIPLGGESGLPMFTMAGNYYSLTYTWVISYSYLGTSYTKTLSPSDTEVMVQVVAGLPEYSGDPTKPAIIQLRVSDDLVNWVVPQGVVIPNPRPTQVLNIIALLPKTTSFLGQTTASRRFFEYVQTTITPITPITP